MWKFASRAAVLVLILWLLLFPTPSHLWRRRRRRRIKRLAVEEGEAEYCSNSDRTSSSSNPQPVPCPIADEALLVIIVATTVAIISACITFLSIKFYRIRRSTHLRFADCGRGVVIAVARESGSTSIVYCRDIDNSGDGDGRPFQLYKFENRTFWTNEELTNERIKVGSLLNYQRDVSPYQILCKLGSLDRKQFVGNAGGKPQDINKLLMDLQDKSVFSGLKEAHGYVNLKAHRFQGFLEKLYTKLHLAHTRIYFIGIRAFTIKNERITLETVDKEWLDMPLNCRESLVLSTASVYLQLERPRKVADDDSDDGGDHDVHGVAVVKFEAFKFTCEGLISRYKAYIISRDEEPVEIQNACGRVIPVPGCWRVLFDTGNEAATGISRKRLSELNLQPDPNKKRKVKLSGGSLGQFETVEILLIIRQHHFNVCALVDAVAEGTDLLVGMDIIQKLFDLGYTIGD